MRERHQQIKFINSDTYRNRGRQRSEMHINIRNIAKAMVNLMTAYNSFFNSAKEVKETERDAMEIKHIVKS